MPVIDPISAIIEKILEEEGWKYTNDPNDPGGPTKYGITQATLAAWRGHPVSPDDVKALLMDEAAKIYRKRYYSDPGFDQVNEISAALAAKLTDAGVNVGTGTATIFLQRALNVFNQGGTLYADLSADGKIGPRAIAALKVYLFKRGIEGETVLLRAVNDLQGARYISLAETHEKDEEFVYGWIAQRVS